MPKIAKELLSYSEELESQADQAALKRIPKVSKNSTAETACRDSLQREPAEIAAETKESKRFQKNPKDFKRIHKILEEPKKFQKNPKLFQKIPDNYFAK